MSLFKSFFIFVTDCTFLLCKARLYFFRRQVIARVHFASKKSTFRQTMNPQLQRLKHHWLEENPNLDFGINEAEIPVFEQKHDFLPPHDFCEYLMFLCTPRWGVEVGWLYFWPFRKMQTAAELYGKDSTENASKVL